MSRSEMWGDEMMDRVQRAEYALAMLKRRGVITTDPKEEAVCCGSPRDADGFCTYRPHHPIYVGVTLPEGQGDE